MITEHIYKRLTHKYRDAWRDLDNRQFVGSIRVTAPTVTEQPRDFDDGGVLVQWARMPAGVDKREFIRAIESTLSYSGCRHEYDCCGCASNYVRASYTGRKIRIETRISYNY